MDGLNQWVSAGGNGMEREEREQVLIECVCEQIRVVQGVLGRLGDRMGMLEGVCGGLVSRVVALEGGVDKCA